MADTSIPHTGDHRLPALRLVDSVAELTSADAGCVAVTASHGGLSAGRYALAVGPALTVFNDAGVGLREAGVAALPLMQAAGMAACTVAHTSACIGQANSTWDTGVVSFANEAALAWGVRPGQTLQGQLAHRVMLASAGLPGRHCPPDTFTPANSPGHKRCAQHKDAQAASWRKSGVGSLPNASDST